jgi:phage tail-like protein
VSVSEPRFFSFRRPPDWGRGTSFQLEVRAEGAAIVREQVYRQLRRQQIANPQLASPVLDLTVDRAVRWFLMDSTGVIWRTDLASGHAEAIAQVPLHAGSVQRLAATKDSILVMQSEESSSLQSMSTDRAQIKWTVSEWNGETFYGYALAAVPDGGVVVLSSLGDKEGLQLLRFHGDGTEHELVPLPHIEGSEFAKDRFSVLVNASNQAWLLDKEKQQITWIGLGAHTVSVIPFVSETETVEAIADGGSDSFWGLVQSSQGEGSTRSLVRMNGAGRIEERGFAGSGEGSRLFAGHGSLYVWDLDALLVQTIRPKLETAVWKGLNRRLGVWISDALDSRVDGTIWHKVVLDSMQHNDTQIIVRCYASDVKEVIIDHERISLDTYITKPDITAEEKLAALSDLWLNPLKDPEDALLKGAEGRYLWVFVELIGSELHSPVIRSLEVHFPRSSYLEYLPSIYQRHEPSSDFLSRYLSLFQTLLDRTDRSIDQVARSFDADNASGNTLRWLLGWLGIEAEDYWTEEQLKELLKRAPVLYNMRGTKYAMEEIISIYTGDKPIILEYNQIEPLKQNPQLGEAADRLYAADPHVFNVLVKAEHADTEIKRVTLQQIIESFKPAFATCKLIVLQPWVYMDLHSYLGMNTVLSEPTLLALDGRSSMPHHTITIDVDQDNRMDQHTRLGIDSRLE